MRKLLIALAVLALFVVAFLAFGERVELRVGGCPIPGS